MKPPPCRNLWTQNIPSSEQKHVIWNNLEFLPHPSSWQREKMWMWKMRLAKYNPGSRWAEMSRSLLCSLCDSCLWSRGRGLHFFFARSEEDAISQQSCFSVPGPLQYVCVPIGVGCFWADACAHLASKKQCRAPLGVRRRRQINSQSRSLAIAQTLNKNF